MAIGSELKAVTITKLQMSHPLRLPKHLDGYHVPWTPTMNMTTRRVGHPSNIALA